MRQLLGLSLLAVVLYCASQQGVALADVLGSVVDDVVASSPFGVANTMKAAAQAGVVPPISKYSNPIGNVANMAEGAAEGLVSGLSAAVNPFASSNPIGNILEGGRGLGMNSLAANSIGQQAAMVGEAATIGAGLGAAALPAAAMAAETLPVAAAAGAAGAVAAETAATETAAITAGSVLPAEVAAVGAAQGAAALGEAAYVADQSAKRQVLAGDAVANAQAEAAIAGSDMLAHGLNNARSASLASNAYRQAQLASARDRVNIAGTIQNSARISDAAIATHDTATKAEDSLLGSELAVDSAATVLDSDAAYIPPVTNSLLRSLPYGRLGLRNIIPRPLTYPSVLLPDVWLNGLPTNYLNVPFRFMPYGLGPTGPAAAYAATAGLGFGAGASKFYAGGLGFGSPFLGGIAAAEGLASGLPLAAGYAGLGPLAFGPMSAPLLDSQLVNWQPFISGNSLYFGGFNNIDPQAAFLLNGLNPFLASSIFPILANGEVAAADEIVAAQALGLSLQNGAGMGATYGGFGRLNTIPMLTGSVSEATFLPTTTLGVTYPIGSALVIEPRDSYFQDYIDSASSRQNFDERQQY